jgi:Arc/MetJ family transcription regulator
VRTTVTLDDELLAAASAAIGVSERSVVLHEGLKLLVQREAARRLALLGGSDPVASIPLRRRAEPPVKAHSKRRSAK